MITKDSTGKSWVTKRLCSALVIWGVVAAGAAEAQFSMQISFTNFVGRGTLTNFPALVKLTPGNTGNYTGFLDTTNGWDLRFWTNSALTGTELHYEIETFATNGTSCIWVQVPALTQNSAIWASWGDVANTSQQPYTTNGAVWADYHAVYHLNGADGSGKWPDSSGNGAHLTEYGSTVTEVSGLAGGGVSFPGVNGNKLLYDIAGDPGYNQWTVTLFVKASSVDTATFARQYVGVFNNDSANDFQIDFDASANYRYQGVGGSAVIGAAAMTWQMLAISQDATAPLTQTYFNGQPGATWVGSNHEFGQYEIGVNRGENGTFYGIVDEVRISSVTRSSNYVWACHMNIGAEHSNFVSYGSVLAPAGVILWTGLNTTNILQTSAWASASVNTNLDTCILVWEETATAPDPGTTNDWSYFLDLGTPSAGVVTAKMTNLVTDTAYTWRLYGTNGTTNAWSDAVNFSTQSHLNVMTNTAGDLDSWNTSGNWSLGRVPIGTDWAIVNTNIAASVNTAPPDYTGELILRDGASLRIRNVTNTDKALGTERITLHQGASILVGRYATVTFPAVDLEGNATINSSDVDHQPRIFPEPISGPYTLTLVGRNNIKFQLNAANTFTNLIANANGRYVIEANAAGALGLGNVTINKSASDDQSAVLVINTSTGAFADGAVLRLSGKGWNNTTLGDYPGTAFPLKLNHNATVDKLFLYGVQLNAGTYNNSEWWLDGAGTLTVLTDPPALAPELTSITDNVFGDTIYENYGIITFTVTFDMAMDPATITAADFGNALDAAVSVGTVAEVSATTYTVPVIINGPGQLQLQINQGTVLNSSVDEAMDTSTAISGGATITILAGDAPATTITGTAGSSDSWNEVSNWGWGVPDGVQDAIVDTGITAQVNTAPPRYDGTLTLQAGATLRINASAALSVLPTASNALIMNHGATLNYQVAAGDITISCPIVLNGTGAVTVGTSWQTRRFGGQISGTGTLSLTGGDAIRFRLQAANTHSGGTVVSSSQRVVLNADSNGAFGTGNVTINANTSLEIGAGLADVIADTATLYLNGAKSSMSTAKVVLDSAETVNILVVDGAVQRMGTYGSSSSGATYQDDNLFSGTNVLNVLGPNLPSIIRFR